MEHFKRLHLFNGMLVTEEDWNVGVDYHVKKSALHNRVFRGQGVVAHFREGLSVRALHPPGMKLVVNPGLALDAQGRELLLLEPLLLSVNPEDFQTDGNPFSGHIFVCISYEERPSDFSLSETDSRNHGYRRIEEGAQIKLSSEGVKPGEIELGRIQLSPDALRITDAPDFREPKPGEIDLRYVSYVGQSGGQIDSVTRRLLMGALELRYALLGKWLLEFDLSEANFPRPAILALDAMIPAGSLDRVGLVRMLLGISRLEQDMTTLIQRKTGRWERVWVSKEFKAYREARERSQEALQVLAEGPTPATDSSQYEREVGRAVAQFRAVNSVLERLTEQLPKLLEWGGAEGPVYQEFTDTEIQETGTELSTRIALNGKPFELVDRLEVTNPVSVAGHMFRLDAGRNDVVQGSTPAIYPDGTKMTDGGLSYRRGSVFFQINNVKPGRDMLVVRRIELRELKVEEEVRVDDQPVGLWKIEGDDREHRWRNMLYHVDGEFLVGSSPRLRLKLAEGSSPANMYRFWFYQAV